MTTTPKQAFEWVKTGHWSFAEFNKWFVESKETNLNQKESK